MPTALVETDEGVSYRGALDYVDGLLSNSLNSLKALETPTKQFSFREKLLNDPKPAAPTAPAPQQMEAKAEPPKAEAPPKPQPQQQQPQPQAQAPPQPPPPAQPKQVPQETAGVSGSCTGDACGPKRVPMLDTAKLTVTPHKLVTPTIPEPEPEPKTGT